MRQYTKLTLLTAIGAIVVLGAVLRIGAAAPATSGEVSGDAIETASTESDSTKEALRVTLDEARSQAKLLHEAFHITLQVVHRSYYREDEGLPIPSESLERVFAELSRQRGIEFHWLAVNAHAMSMDHEPKGEFELKAVEVLKSGQESFEQVEEDVYRHVGSITLFSQCLKCHAPNRTSNRERLAGLVISIPVKQD